MDLDDLSLMQAYLRSQAARMNPQMDWFFDQPELTDDGDHPLLEDIHEPRYSRQVMRRAFATWAKLDNKNPFKFVCNYYHALEKLGENSPPHMRQFVKESLEVPAGCKETPDQLLTHNRRQETPVAMAQYHYNQNARPCYYKHHNDASLLRYDPAFANEVGTDFSYSMEPNAPRTQYDVLERSLEQRIQFEQAVEKSKVPSDVYELYCKSLSYKLYGPIEEVKSEEKLCEEEQKLNVPESPNMKCKTQTSVDSTPSKASEADSCYQSMCSPVTDQEEE